MTEYMIFTSPAGLVTVSTDGAAITGLHLEGDRYFQGVPSGWVENPRHPLLLQTQTELTEYLAGERRRFELPLAPTGTPFQEKVWNIIAQIPIGVTATYAGIAETIGNPKAVRAVGGAVGRNPICIIVPCHRVLPSGGGLGGYVAGIEFKKRLLSLEGVTVQ